MELFGWDNEVYGEHDWSWGARLVTADMLAIRFSHGVRNSSFQIFYEFSFYFFFSMGTDKGIILGQTSLLRNNGLLGCT